MSKHTDGRPVRQSHLPHDGQELPGAPPPDARTLEDAQKNAEEMIRSLIVEQKREASPKRLPQLAPQDELPVDPTPPMAVPVRAEPETEDPVVRHIADTIEEEEDVDPQDERQPARRRRLRLPRVAMPSVPRPNLSLPNLKVPRVIRNYRPTPRHVAVALIAIIMVMHPLLLPILVVLAFWLGLIVYLTMGPQRCAEIGAGLWTRFCLRHPERAERLRRRADVFAERFDRLLDRLPEPWADRLALPDFSTSTGDDADRPDPFDRLAAQTRDA